MDHPAGLTTTPSTSSTTTITAEQPAELTPWESIDPDEPAGGPTLAHARSVEDDAEAVAVYHAADNAPSDAESIMARVHEPTVTSTASEPESATAFLPEHPETPHVGSASADAEPPDARAANVLSPRVSTEALVEPVSERIAEAPAVLHGANDFAGEQIAATDGKLDCASAFNPPDLMEMETVGVTSQPESIAEDTTEFFGQTIDRLDAMPDTLAAISDITEVVGEQPARAEENVIAADAPASASAPVLQHVGPRFDRARAVEPVQTAAAASLDAALIEAANDAGTGMLSEPELLREAQCSEEEVSPGSGEEFLPAACESSEVAADVELDAQEQVAAQEAQLAESIFADEDELEPDYIEARWEDPELDSELEPVASGAGGGWTIPLLCAGIALIACCMVIPQADANRRLAYEKMTLTADLESIQKQVSVNDEFLKKVVDDPSLSERLAQRQLKQVRKGQHVLKLREERPEMSPFQITAVTPPPAPPPYRPLPGVIASLCYNARTRLYLMGLALAMIAVGLVMGAAPMKLRNAE
jgi:hypothetical protein